MQASFNSASALKSSRRPPNLERRPLRLRLESGRGWGLGIILTSGAISIFPVYTLVSVWPALEVGLVVIVAVFLLFSLAGIYWGLLNLCHRLTATIDGAEVRGEARRLLRRCRWTVLLTSYRGVQLKSVSKGGRTMHVVLLAHPQEENSISLYVATDLDRARRQWERAAKHFGLPAIEAGVEGERVREVEQRRIGP